MAQAIQIQINSDLLDLAKAYEGKKGNYITISGVIKDEEDQYGNRGYVKQFIPNDETEMPILGNIKIKNFDSNERKSVQSSNHITNDIKMPTMSKEVQNFEDESNELPF